MTRRTNPTFTTNPTGVVASLIAILCAAVLAGCASQEPLPEIDPLVRENAIFACKKQIEASKRAHFEKLPKLLQRIAGDNQVLREFERPPSKGDISRAIAKFPLAGDSGGMWGTAKEAHSRTVSTRFASKLARPKDPKKAARVDIGDPEMLSMGFGQPARVYEFPTGKLKPIGQGSLGGDSQDDQLKIRVLDEHHVLIEATTRPKATATNFYSSPLFAVVRTYVEQTYLEESATQLSDYPVDGAGLEEDICDQEVDR